MPAALERKLKRQIAGKNWSEERKDAYVYGTLRKTGWKPSTQKKKKQMSISDDRVVRLAAINSQLDEILFQDDDDDQQPKKPFLGQAAKTAAGVGAAAAGTTAGLYGVGRYAGAPGGLANVGKAIGTGADVVGQKVAAGVQAATPAVQAGLQTAKSGIMNVLKRFKLSANGELIYFGPTIANPKASPGDPGADKFGGTDPGIQAQIEADKRKFSALQKLRLKIASLGGMGLHNA